MDVSLGFDFVVVGQSVDLVNENFELDVRVYFVRAGHSLVQLRQRLHVVILGVNDKHERTTAAENVVRVERRIKEVNLKTNAKLDEPDLAGAVAHLSRKVPNGE